MQKIIFATKHVYMCVCVNWKKSSDYTFLTSHNKFLFDHRDKILQITSQVGLYLVKFYWCRQNPRCCFNLPGVQTRFTQAAQTAKSRRNVIKNSVSQQQLCGCQPTEILKCKNSHHSWTNVTKFRTSQLSTLTHGLLYWCFKTVTDNF